MSRWKDKLPERVLHNADADVETDTNNCKWDQTPVCAFLHHTADSICEMAPLVHVPFQLEISQ